MYGLPDAAAVKARLRFEASENQMHNIPDTPAYLLHVGGRYQDTTAVNLVDGGAVTSTPITVSDQADPKARNYLKVRVNITHHTRGDLALDLIAPTGRSTASSPPAPTPATTSTRNTTSTPPAKHPTDNGEYGSPTPSRTPRRSTAASSTGDSSSSVLNRRAGSGRPPL